MKEKILFLTAYVPNKAAAGEKNTMIMLNDLASCYDVDLIYFKYDWENDYVPERGNVNTKLTIRNSIMTKLKNVCNFPFGECNLNSVWFLFLLNHNKYNFFFLDLQMLLKVVFGCVQGRRRMSRLYTLAHIRELPFLCV